jgi:ComF family protein
MMQNLDHFRPVERLLNILAPCHCILCGLPSERALTLCSACEDEIPANSPACPRCALPLVEAAPECGQCLRRPPAFTATIAPRLYAEPLSGFIKSLKFRGDLSLLPVLTELMAAAVASRLEQGPAPDALVPMPLHWLRRWRRGFNQADLLARSLALHPRLRNTCLIVDSNMCRRRRATRPQHGLDAKSRRRNLHNAIECKASIDGLSLAIVDDVMTTGTSADALARALLKAGAGQVEVWCCARTPTPTAGSAIHG